ncbi:MAG: efflux RND transporter periplasmic adaptor subunit [Bacteroidetes bacterium]|nr:efflux RND transporter periplasmic adaptor subunit [Bacteroidota bacterium]MDA1336619.1 efflux RND transporter periplasmic adaptor subunit [Bacteroidota bacterium]
MKKGRLYALLLFIFLVLFGAVYTLNFLYDQEQQEEATYRTESPRVGDIVIKTVAAGSIQPRQEILIKPQISGIVRRVAVEAGELVQTGQVMAEVMVVPDMGALSNAESRLQRARIALADADATVHRNQGLLEEGIISEANFQSIELAQRQAQEELYAAEDNLKIIQDGVASRNGRSSNTLIKSTIDGMVLDVPVKKGNSVIEANNFNEGTTIAAVADMNDLIFVGRIDESEVEKLSEGMDIQLTIGAIEGLVIPAKLEYISPKGLEEAGAIQFEIKAAVELAEGQFLRAGYSANANVVLDERKQVMTISEMLVQYGEEGTFVEVLIGENQFEKRPVTLGLSDGITVEVLDGVSLEDKLKVWNQPQY